MCIISKTVYDVYGFCVKKSKLYFLFFLIDRAYMDLIAN